MQKMSGLDLRFAVAELASLQGKRLAKIKRTDTGLFLFKIGGEEILFEPGVRLHMTRQSLAAKERPDGFVAFLRKNFEGKTAATISQVPGERIVEITAKSKEKLIFELFRTGNLIAVGEDGAIAACLQIDEAGGRKVARGEKYAYPKATPFEFKVPAKQGFFVQENEAGAPVSYSLDAAKGGKEFPSISAMLDYYYANQTKDSEAERAAKERAAKLGERLKSQEDALVKLAQERVEAKAKGDALWQELDGIDTLLSVAKEMKKKGMSDAEINAALSGKKAKLRGMELEVEIGG